MKIAVYSSKPYDIEFLKKEFPSSYELTFFAEKLGIHSAALAKEFEAICIFVNDVADKEVLNQLVKGKTRVILLRCAGFNNVDLLEAKSLGIKVYRVPSYSPYAVAEHAVGLTMCLNRKIHRAYNRVREHNFSLDGFVGFDLKGKTIGVIGTGQIGAIFSRIMLAFGTKILAYDVIQNDSLVKDNIVKYVSLDEVFQNSDIISLHVPLFPTTHHLINESSIAKMKTGVMIINTSRGALLDTKAVINGLKSGKIGYLGVDVYEEESDLFFEDLSNKIITDDVFARLLTFPNVIVTGHQAFFTSEAQSEIARVTHFNITEFEQGKDTNELTKTVEKRAVEKQDNEKEKKEKEEHKQHVIAVSHHSWAKLRAVGFMISQLKFHSNSNNSS